MSSPRPIARLSDDLLSIRTWLKQTGQPDALGDFEESFRLKVVQATVRVWEADGLAGVAYVDDYDNLWFAVAPGDPNADEMATEMIAWGEACIQMRTQGKGGALDTVCEAGNSRRISLLEAHGFVRQSVRTLRYSRSLAVGLPEIALPAGFTIRAVGGEDEVEAITTLHRAAFGSEIMTTEYRLAMMCAPGYRGDLDLVAVAQDGALAAFCMCGVEPDEMGVGYTDPIGTHPAYRRMGLAGALMAEGMRRLYGLGVRTVQLGTSSDNPAMQALAARMGFGLISEKYWFSKEIA